MPVVVQGVAQRQTRAQGEHLDAARGGTPGSRCLDHGVGAVILTNADAGVIVRRPLLRRLLEVPFDGNPEAQQMRRTPPMGAIVNRR